MSTKIEQLTEIIKASNNIVFFGGAEVSIDTHNKFPFLFNIKKLRIKNTVYSFLK